MPKLTKTAVESTMPRAKQFTIWCSELKGFGVFVPPSGSVHISWTTETTQASEGA